MIQMTHDQVIDLVMSLYTARPEAKEYLEFFLQPDIDQRLERSRTLIIKEFNRRKRFPRPRVTKIRQYIRDISSLDPGPEPVVDIMAFAVETACAVGDDNWLLDVTQRNMAKLLTETLVLADRNGILDLALPRLTHAVEAMHARAHYSRAFKGLLKDALESSL